MSERIDKLVSKLNNAYSQHLKKHSTYPVLKYELYSPTGEFKDVVLHRKISSWQDTQIEVVRRDTSGAYRQASVPIEFVFEAAEILRDLFATYGLRAQVGMRFYARHWSDNDYDLIKDGLLDFETYIDDGIRVSLQIVADEISELIKSRGNTKYDISVSELKDSKPWAFERLENLCSINYQMPMNQGGEGQEIPLGVVTLPYIYYSSNEVVKDGLVHEGLDQQYSYSYFRPPYVGYKQSYFFRATDDGNITINISVLCKINLLHKGTIIGGYIQKTNLSSDPDLANWQTIFTGGGFPNDPPQYKTLSFLGQLDTTVEKNDVFRLIIRLNSSETGILGNLTLSFNYLNIQWLTKGKQMDVNVIKPIVLGQKLLDKMANREGYGLEIYWRNQDYSTRICAAESIRQFSNPYIHASFKDFISWMRVLGYEGQYQGKKIIFRERDYFYNPDKANPYMSLSERENKNLVISANSDLAWTGVKIGYNKKDYNNTNGRFEVNTTFEYTTGYTTKGSEQILSLISPYRADSLGIEFLCQESLDKTKDTSSDNDIFFVALIEGENRYTTYRDEDISVRIAEWGNARIIKIFNGVFAPPRLIEYNKSLIGVITDMINFTSTDGYRNASANVNLYGDIAIDKKMHKPITYKITVGSHQRMPMDTESINRPIRFENGGNVYYGFIYDVYKNYGEEQPQDWTFYAID